MWQQIYIICKQTKCDPIISFKRIYRKYSNTINGITLDKTHTKQSPAIAMWQKAIRNKRNHNNFITLKKKQKNAIVL